MRARELLCFVSITLASALPVFAQTTTTIVGAAGDGYAVACGDNLDPVFTSLDTTDASIYTFNTQNCLARGIVEFELPNGDPSRLVSATLRGTLIGGGGHLFIIGYEGNGSVELADATANSAPFFGGNFVGGTILSGTVPQSFSVLLDLAYVKSLLGSTLGLSTRTIEGGGVQTLIIGSTEGAAGTRPVLVLEFSDAAEPNTPTGTNVLVTPDLPSGAASVSMTFDSVESVGETTVTISATSVPPPDGFKLTTPPVLLDIETTATFSGNVRVCLGWSEGQVVNENKVAIHHYEDEAWVDITDPGSRDSVNNVVCGTTTSLSPFALFDVKYPFTGFFAPVENAPIVNAVKAGAAVPVKFSLRGDLGLNIFAASFPRTQLMQCDTLAGIDEIAETVTAGASSLSYDPDTGQYTYIWKTDKAWGGSCRELQIKLTDGEVYKARFTLRK